MRCRRALLLYRGQQGSSSRLSPPRLAPTRVHADEACSAMLAGWLLSWCSDRVFTKICMPPRRCLPGWPRSCMLPRRCVPSWLAGCCVGTAMGQRNLGKCGPGCGPADVPGKGLAGVLWASPARVLPGAFVFWFSSSVAGLQSSQRSACHHTGAFRALVPDVVDGVRTLRLKGGGLAGVGQVAPASPLPGPT